MFSKKLVSVRIDEDVLDAIDRYSSGVYYYKRSAVINLLLRAAVEAAICEDGKLKNEGRNLGRLNFTANFK